MMSHAMEECEKILLEPREKCTAAVLCVLSDGQRQAYELLALGKREEARGSEGVSSSSTSFCGLVGPECDSTGEQLGNAGTRGDKVCKANSNGEARKHCEANQPGGVQEAVLMHRATLRRVSSQRGAVTDRNWNDRRKEKQVTLYKSGLEKEIRDEIVWAKEVGILEHVERISDGRNLA